MSYPQLAKVTFITAAEKSFYVKYATSSTNFLNEYINVLLDKVARIPPVEDEISIQRSFADAETAEAWFTLVRKHAPLAGARVDQCILL